MTFELTFYLEKKKLNATFSKKEIERTNKNKNNQKKIL